MTTSVNAYPYQETDTDRASRLFVGFMNSIVGADQTYVGQDGYPINPTGQFVVANPDGSFSMQGQPRSNMQQPLSLSTLPPGLVLVGLAAIAWFVLKKGRVL